MGEHSAAALKFRLREPNWWVASDGAGRWEYCRHGDGYYYCGWRGVVDGQHESVSFGGHARQADVLYVIEQSRDDIEQVVRQRRARKEEVCHG